MSEISLEMEMLTAHSMDFDRILMLKDEEIVNFKDARGWRIQHVVASEGHLGAVTGLINHGFQFEDEIGGKTPADFAFENQHFDVVLNLAKANFRLPSNYNNEVAPEELKRFVVLSESLHASIENEEISRIEEILTQNSELKYFYNSKNKSAASTAITERKFEIYENLLSRNVALGPQEDLDQLLDSLKYSERRILREIHCKLSKSVLAEPMATLTRNSFFGPGCPDLQEHRNFVHEAYNSLNQIPDFQNVFKIVVASRNFQIFFDFTRDSVNFLDPTSEPYTSGLFYPSGKIFIGAKDLLDANRKFEVLGTMAHELTHYAIYLTYENSAKPYSEKDLVLKNEFEAISDDCEEKKGEESLVELAFDCYPREMHHAELIVRVPHMLAQYHNQPDILAQKRQTFNRLFNFYEQNCVPDMERALPRIKKKFRSEKQKKSERRKRNLWIVSMVFGLFMVLGLPICIWLWLQSFSWENLSDNQKASVQGTSINYLDCKVNFGKIFHENSLIYNNLTSSQILGAIWGSPFEFPRTVDEKMEEFVHLNSSNLPECLKNKLLNSNVNFQGQNLTISELLTNKSRAFKLLESPQIVQIMKGQKTFAISKKIKQKAKFYIEREFADEYCLKKKEGNDYEDGDGNSTCCFECQRSNLSAISIHIQVSKIFFLSSTAGQGKTTTFRHFGLKLKEKWPRKWVEFVDLKKNLDAFEIGNRTNLSSSEVLENFLAKTLLNLTDFESAVFNEKFQNGEAIFLWDGIDEISPFFKDFMLNLTLNYKEFTDNWQFASTRPQFLKEFEEKLNISAFGLAPLDNDKKFEFLLKFVLFDQLELDVDNFYKSIRPFLNFFLPVNQILTDLHDSNAFSVLNEANVEKILKAIENGDKILTSIQKSDQKVGPILIEMAVEAAKNENFSISENFNIFLLYENFVDKKIKIALEKGEVVKNDTDKWFKEETLTVYKAHQDFALKTIFLTFSKCENTGDIRKMVYFWNKKIKKVLKKKSNVEISRFGILNVNFDKDFDFVHRTFAEFFVAKFLINNLIEDFSPNNDQEITFCLFVISKVFSDEKFQVVKKFITDFLDLNQNENLSFTKHLQQQNLRSETVRELTENEEIVEFFQAVDISYYFVEKFKISPQLIKLPFYNYHRFPYDILLLNWEKLEKIFGQKKMRFALEIKTSHSLDLLDAFSFTGIENGTVLVPQILKLYAENFNETQIQEIFVDWNEKYNVLMRAAEVQNVEFVGILQTFMKKYFNSEEIKEILKLEYIHANTSLLEYSGTNKNVEIFLFVKKIYNETFTLEEIKELVLTSKDEIFPVLHITTNGYSSQVCIEISKFMFELFNDDIFLLKNLFKRKAKEEKKDFHVSKGETILSYIKTKRKHESCFEFYKENWRNFYEDEESFEAEFKEMLNE